MSPGSFGIAPKPPISLQNETTRAAPMPYDAPLNLPARRKSPSPGLSRRYPPYENYNSSRAGSSTYRDDFSNNYRPNVWRPDQPSTYYSRSPSPDRYDSVRTPPDGEARDRRGSWQPYISSPVLDRRQTQPPASGSWDRSRRDTLATPMFEPSDSWKQTHTDRPNRLEVSRPSSNTRYSDHRSRDFRDFSPDRSSFRPGYESPYYPIGGDRYRPSGPGYRDPRRADTYRPQYDDDWPGSQPHGHSPSRSAGSVKRESVSAPYEKRSTTGYHGARSATPERSSSLTPGISPIAKPRVSGDLNGSRSVSNPERPPTGRPTGAYDRDGPPPRKKMRSRSSSRSSRGSRSYSSTRSTPQPNFPDNAHSLSTKNLDTNRDLRSTRQQQQQQQIHRGKSAYQLPESYGGRQGRTNTHSENARRLSNRSVTRSISPATSIGSSNNEVPVVQPTAEPSVLTPQPPLSVGVVLTDPQRAELAPDAPVISTPSAVVSPPSDNLPVKIEPEAHRTVLNGAHVPPSSPPPSTGQHSLDVNQSTPADNTFLPPTANGVLQHSSPVEVIADEPKLDPDEDIPPLADAKSTAEALRIVVMTRLRCDRQTRNERVNPVLMANLSIAEPPAVPEGTTPTDLVREFSEGKRLQKRTDAFAASKPSFLHYFADRSATVEQKQQRLRDEYVDLHGQWLEHCARLDNSTKSGIIAAQEATAAPLGRTTRRSTAILGDAVRTDLEMEQIIATLGNDDQTDPNFLSTRNLAVIPDMISVTEGNVNHLFDDTNNRVDNPIEFYGPDTGLHDWTEEEKEIFLERFAAYPKQFGVIAERLPNKTAAQCVDYYYLHKKMLIDFRKAVSKFGPGKRRGRRADKYRGGGLLADIRQHDDEVHRAVGSSAINGPLTRRRRVLPITNSEPRKPLSSRRTATLMELTPMSTPTPDPEPDARQRRRRVNPTARASASMGRDDGEEDNTDPEPKKKRGRKSRKEKEAIAAAAAAAAAAAMVPDDSVSDQIDDAKISDQNEFTTSRKSAPGNFQWSDGDKNIFLSLLSQYGDNFKRIAASMPNKTTIQVSNYYNSNLVDLDLAKVASGAPKRSPTPEQSRHAMWTETSRYSGPSHYPGSGVMSLVRSSVEGGGKLTASANAGKQNRNVVRRPDAPSDQTQRSTVKPQVPSARTIGLEASHTQGVKAAGVQRPLSPGQSYQQPSMKNDVLPGALTPAQLFSRVAVTTIPYTKFHESKYPP